MIPHLDKEIGVKTDEPREDFLSNILITATLRWRAKHQLILGFLWAVLQRRFGEFIMGTTHIYNSAAHFPYKRGTASEEINRLSTV